jgi:hypothetical protein
LSDRRRGRRRSIPFVRSAVLQVDGRNHIVALQDLGPEGAFLATRVIVKPQHRLVLKIVLPRSGHEVSLPCELVWRNASFDATIGRRAGVAVRFKDLAPEILRRTEEFATQGFLPTPEPTPSEYFEYRTVSFPELDVDELNRLGRDGWRLVSTLASDKGVQLVLMRRL